MNRVVGIVVLVLGIIGAGVVFFEGGPWESLTRGENMERYPPELDPLRTELLAELHLEPIIEAEGPVGRKLKSKVVVITYAFLPADIDQKDLESRTKSIAKKYFPNAESIRVQLKGRR